MDEHCWAKHPHWYLLFCSRHAGHEGTHTAHAARGEANIDWPNHGEGATIYPEEDDHDCIDWNSGGACYICRRPLSIEEQTRGLLRPRRTDPEAR